ncbi:MAG: hypothetical protein II178_01075, partial [Selenomonadaceae bacterium]|nr:hypothetical protein [Selenomonadaceae bacterium]
VKHNGHKTRDGDSLLPGVKEYLDAIPVDDKIIIFTAREEKYRDLTCQFLNKKKIRYDKILFGMPLGERIVVNDRKPSGLDMSVAINLDRDCFEMPEIIRDL